MCIFSDQEFISVNSNPSTEVLPEKISASNTLADAITPLDLSIKLYSPRKVLVVALLGGILGGCILHWLNLKALHQDQKANQTLIWSVPFLVILPIFSLLTHISLTGVGGAVAAGYMMEAKRSYGSIYQQHSDHNGKLGGWWAAIGIGIASLLISIGLSVPICLLVTLAMRK
jgi:hypothetical protein